MNNKIERIKTALGDGSCKSIYIEMINSREAISLFTMASSISFSRLIRQLKSKDFRGIEYNLIAYADLDIGDVVYTPDGEGILYEKSYLYDVKLIDRTVIKEYRRHELILLEKATAKSVDSID